MSNYETLVAILNRFTEQSKTAPLTLGTALDSLDEASYAFIAIILVLPFLQPLPLGPFYTIGGFAFAALGWQLYRGHESPVLPQKLRAISLNKETWQMLTAVCLKILGLCRKISRPRYSHWLHGRRGQRTGGLVLIAGGLLMAIPFLVLPLNNVLPALAILFYGIAELEDDGLMLFIAFGWLAVTVIYFSIFFVMLWLFGKEALHYFGG